MGLSLKINFYAQRVVLSCVVCLSWSVGFFIIEQFKRLFDHFGAAVHHIIHGSRGFGAEAFMVR
jgi:hypothetical protein